MFRLFFQKTHRKLHYSVYLHVLQTLGAIIPLGIIVYASARIFIVVVRTTRRIAAEGYNIGTMGDAVDSKASQQMAQPSPIGTTLKSIRSTRYILAICFFYIFIITFNMIVDIVHAILDTKKSTWAFAAFWLFFSHTSVNSFLYICLHGSFRKAAKKLLLSTNRVGTTNTAKQKQ